ncbi:hypothetical protein HY604_04825 [Candidatus Peregrinibacteria bacterium]|nr:hypothetical protein [Candidatus Peregrinibacteria bacterium]
MKKISTAEWILRIGIFGTFLGHGIFGLEGKEAWIPLVTAFGFTESTATTLLPIIGGMDVAIAVLALLYPARIILIWAAIWGFMTALSRPMADQPFWDFVERWANWAAPLALLALQGFPKKFKELFKVR